MTAAQQLGKSLVAFSLPFFISLIVIIFYAGNDNSQLIGSRNFVDSPEIQEIVKVTGSHQSIEIPLPIENFYTGLGSNEKKDFFLIAWFRFLDLPQVSEKVGLFEIKKSGSKKVYCSLMLRKEAEGFHPAVFWRAENGKGDWYSFNQTAIYPREWFALILAYSESKYLGLYSGVLQANGKFKFSTLGGFQVDSMEHLEKPLLSMGSIGTGKFRGRIGPLQIYSVKRLERSMKSALLADALTYDGISEYLENSEKIIEFTSYDDVKRKGSWTGSKGSGSKKSKSKKD